MGRGVIDDCVGYEFSFIDKCKINIINFVYIVLIYIYLFNIYTLLNQKNMKKIIFGTFIILLMTIGTLFSTTNSDSNSNSKISLTCLTNQAYADCEVSLPGYPGSPCTQIYCPSLMMFAGCGLGIGNICFTQKYCP